MGQSQSAALLKGAAKGDLDIVEKMVAKRKVDVETRNNEGKNAKGETPLYLACQGGHANVCQFLLSHGANPNAIVHGVEDQTSLLVALEEKHDEIAVLLASSGADPTTTTKSKRLTPLHKAASGCCEEACSALLSHSAEVNAKDTSGSSPLYFAALSGSVEIVKLLLEHKAKVNAHGKKGRTALQCAVKLGHKDIVEVLLEHGANIDAVDTDGRTAAHEDILDAKKHPKIAKLLAEARDREPPSSDSSSESQSEGGGNGAQKEAPENSDGETEECKICMEERINCVLVPCGHLCVCFECAGPLQTCPICRANIESKLRTFHA